MEKPFAKLFDFDDHQVLILSETDDETDKPKLTVRTRHQGPVIETSLEFPATEMGDEMLDAAFEKADAEFAAFMRKTVIEGMHLDDTDGA